MNDEQRKALQSICERYNVPFNEEDYGPGLGLPEGWVQGWVGGTNTTIFIGCSPVGEINS